MATVKPLPLGLIDRSRNTCLQTATGGNNSSLTSPSNHSSGRFGDAPFSNNIFVVSATCLNIAATKPPAAESLSYRSLLWRHRFLTITYCMVFWSFGMGVAFLGPTLLDLGCRTGSGFSTISWIFFSQTLFILLGSAAGGWIGIKFPKHQVLLTSVFFLAATLSVIPFCSSLAPLAFTLAVMGFFMGIIDTLANLSMIELYGPYVGPFLQALHFFYGLGAFLAPMVVKPFLTNFDCTPLIDTVHHVTDAPEFHNSTNPTIVSLEAAVKNSSVQYAFWIMATMQVPVLCVLLVVVIRERLRATKAKSSQTFEINADKESELSVNGSEFLSINATFRQVILLTSLTAMLLFLVDGLQAIYASYVYTFAIKVFETIHSAEAAYLNASFWGSFALGRLLSIAISAFVSPQIMLMGNIGGCLSGIVLLLVVSHSRLAVYVGTVCIGLFLSSVYPTSLSLVKTYIDITPSITTVCVVSAAAGEMFMPVIVGHEFGSFGPKSFLITCLTLASAGFVVYLILVLFGRYVKRVAGWNWRFRAVWCLNRKSGNLRGHPDSSIGMESRVSLNSYAIFKQDFLDPDVSLTCL